MVSVPCVGFELSNKLNVSSLVCWSLANGLKVLACPAVAYTKSLLAIGGSWFSLFPLQFTTAVTVVWQFRASCMVKVCIPAGAFCKQKPDCTSWADKGPAISYGAVPPVMAKHTLPTGSLQYEGVVVTLTAKDEQGLVTGVQSTTAVVVAVQPLASVIVKVWVPCGALLKQNPLCTSWAVRGPAMS